MDVSAGIRGDRYAVELYVSNLTDEDAALYYTSQCATGTCGAQNYGVRARPRSHTIVLGATGSCRAL